MKSFRIGCGAGFAGDRIDPARDLAERGRLDVLVFECLAERTIALAQRRRRDDPAAGADPLLAERMRAVLPACRAAGTRIVTNMGAANPLAAGREVLAVGRALGLRGLRVAVVEGDDVLPWVLRHDGALLDDPRSVAALRPRLVSANAYLGADALLPALASGAEVIVCGRVADPALFLAPLMHHFGWAADDWLRLGQGIVVGHLLECAAQVSGGYLAEPGVVEVPGLADLGFPLAEVAADGSACITKLDGSGGRVDRLSVTAQLLYEIEDPARYLQPDVVADFTQVRLEAAGPDRVHVSGGRGAPRPDTLKVSLGVLEGFVGEGQISYGGAGARARGGLALQVLRERLQRLGLGDLEHRAELIGVDALHGPASRAGADPGEVRARLAARCGTRDEAELIGREVEALYLNGPAGGGGVTTSVREVLAVASTLVPRHAVAPRCTLLQEDA